jgi:periplasmic protein TonB
MLVPGTLVPIDAQAGILERVEKTSPASSLLASRTLVPMDAKPEIFESGEKTRSASSLLVARTLLPIDAETAIHQRAVKTLPANPALQAPSGFWGGQASTRDRPALFSAAMLENSPTRPRRGAMNLAVSLAAHAILLTSLILVPLYFTQAIDVQQFNYTLLVAPPAFAPPRPSAAAAVVRPLATPRKMLPTTARLVAPRVIPNLVTGPSEVPTETDSIPGIPSGAGVPGGVPGDQPGGVIGAIVSSASVSVRLPTPSDSAPGSPFRVGGEIKRPQLIFQTAPVYPPIARQAKIAGDVEIEAVIDPQGNVAEMRVVSGKPQLISAAMNAVRHWKYEPTMVGGQAVPLQLLVTVTFRLS